MNQRILGFFTRSILVVGALLAPSLASAQPPATGAAIASDELTAEQYRDLPGDSVIRSGELQITLAELKRQQAARRAKHEAAIRASKAHAARRLEAHRRAARRPQRGVADQSELHTLFAYLRERAASDPEAVRRARAIAANRREAHALWLETNGPAPPLKRERVEKLRRKIQAHPPGE